MSSSKPAIAMPCPLPRITVEEAACTSRPGMTSAVPVLEDADVIELADVIWLSCGATASEMRPSENTVGVKLSCTP